MSETQQHSNHFNTIDEMREQGNKHVISFWSAVNTILVASEHNVACFGEIKDFVAGNVDDAKCAECPITVAAVIVRKRNAEKAARQLADKSGPPPLHTVEQVSPSYRYSQQESYIRRARVRVAGGWVYETHILSDTFTTDVACVFVPDQT